jgi:hypothetical protein
MRSLLLGWVLVGAMGCTQENFQTWPLGLDYLGYIPVSPTDTLVYITNREADTTAWDTLRFQVLENRSFGTPVNQGTTPLSTEVYNGSLQAFGGPPLAFTWDLFNNFNQDGIGQTMGLSYVYLAGLELRDTLPPITPSVPFNAFLAVGTDTLRNVFPQGNQPTFWLRANDYPLAIEFQGRVYIR